MKNEVTVIALDKRYKNLEKDLKRITEQVLLFLKQNKVAVEVYLVGISRMRQLNRQYRGRDQSTNILSFEVPQGFPKTFSKFLGEIYLCPPYIKNHGQDLQTLLAHGILHLLGFNHKGLSDRMMMEKKESEIMQWLNR